MQERETLGAYLRREREQKSISLRELAKKTRVREPFLKAIEEDRYDLLPSPLYARGFLSAYAKYVGLDAHEVLLRYEQSFKKEEVPAHEAKPHRIPVRKGKWHSRPIWMVSGVVAISLLISYFLHPYLSRPLVEPPPIKPELSERLTTLPALETPEAPPAVEEKPFTLELKAVEETWVQIQVNGQTRTEALFKPGEGKTYQATSRIELLIGNAGGLDLVFNGELLKKFGKPGEVVTLIFTPQRVERKGQEESKNR